MYPLPETTSITRIACENYMFIFHHVLGSSESRWRCINKTCKAFRLTVGEGKLFLFGKIFTLPVLRAEFSASKKGKFLERAEIHALLILLPASMRSFESTFF
jgi:hypothetical protein